MPTINPTYSGQNNTMTTIVSSLINTLVLEIVAINAIQKKFLATSLQSLSEEDSILFDVYLKYCMDKEGKTLSYLAQSYDLIVKDTFSNQLYFKRHQKYKYSSYTEVESLVYRNDSYMSMYMYGLAITAFLWKNHTEMKSFFKENLPKNRNGKYLEIGPGHGFHMMEAMQLSQYDYFLGIDISPTSVALTKSILSSQYFGDFHNYHIKECDFIQWNTDDKFDAVVMGEVLEHVEQPQIFLDKIHTITDENSHIHITTCINSPAIDHIYLFRDSLEIIKMVENSGFHVKQQLLVPYQETTLEESKQEKLPINIALVLSKNHD